MMHYMTETTPKVISDEIITFCEQLSPGQTPVFVPVRPQQRATVNHCYFNVERHVEFHDGSSVCGWMIWQSQVLLTADFHCNWLQEDGELIDITPKADSDTEILFLPDPSRKWEGQFVPSQRIARIDHPIVHQLVQVYDERGRLRAKYRFGEEGTPKDMDRYLELKNESGILALQLGGLLFNDDSATKMLPPGLQVENMFDLAAPGRLTTSTKIGRNDPCPCGSGKKYKKCCGTSSKRPRSTCGSMNRVTIPKPER